MDWFLEKNNKDDIIIKPMTVRDNYAKRGGISELFASAYLIRLGYEVFRNVIANGPIDLVAIKRKKIIYVDVKTFTPYIKADGELGYANFDPLKDKQRELGVKVLYVTYDGECSFRKDVLANYYKDKIKDMKVVNKKPSKNKIENIEIDKPIKRNINKKKAPSCKIPHEVLQIKDGMCR